MSLVQVLLGELSHGALVTMLQLNVLTGQRFRRKTFNGSRPTVFAFFVVPILQKKFPDDVSFVVATDSHEIFLTKLFNFFEISSNLK